MAPKEIAYILISWFIGFCLGVVWFGSVGIGDTCDIVLIVVSLVGAIKIFGLDQDNWAEGGDL